MARKKKAAVAEEPKQAVTSQSFKAKESEEDKERSGDYDLETLMRAKEIENDADKMKYVAKALDKKAASIKSIQDLKNVYAAKFEKKVDEK